MKSTRFLLATALGLTLTGALVAQDHNPGPRQHRGRPGAALRARMLDKFDTDKDGKLSEAERAAARARFQDLRGDIIDKFDTDGDGTLSETERAAIREQFQARRAELTAKYDADGDGILGPDERKAMWQGIHKQLLEKFDADGDGKLNEAERKAAMDAWLMRPR